MENIALVPGTNLPVSVNSVHNGNPARPDCIPINPDLYNVNLRDDNFLYNAYLDIFTASLELIPCEVYTIRLSLADVADFRYDSGVFLKAKSFSAMMFSKCKYTKHFSIDFRRLHTGNGNVLDNPMPYQKT